jgi:hypothetical protein
MKTKKRRRKTRVEGKCGAADVGRVKLSHRWGCHDSRAKPALLLLLWRHIKLQLTGFEMLNSGDIISRLDEGRDTPLDSILTASLTL